MVVAKKVAGVQMKYRTKRNIDSMRNATAAAKAAALQKRKGQRKG
jgi:hypothetical protein